MRAFNQGDVTLKLNIMRSQHMVSSESSCKKIISGKMCDRTFCTTDKLNNALKKEEIFDYLVW
jgi:hypothetical protein